MADTSIVEPAVDQQSYSYVLELGTLGLGNTIRASAVRIDYAYRTTLPLMSKNRWGQRVLEPGFSAEQGSSTALFSHWLVV